MEQTMTTTVNGLLDIAKAVADAGLDMMGDVATAISTNAFLALAVVGVPLCGLGIGWLARVLRRKV